MTKINKNYLSAYDVYIAMLYPQFDEWLFPLEASTRAKKYHLSIFDDRYYNLNPRRGTRDQFIGALEPLRRCVNDCNDIFKPYKSINGILNDLAQPIWGILNSIKGILLVLVSLIICLFCSPIGFIIFPIANTVESLIFNFKMPAKKKLLESFNFGLFTVTIGSSWFIEGLAALTRGKLLLLMTPILVPIKLIVRSLNTVINGWPELREHKRIIELVNLGKEALKQKNYLRAEYIRHMLHQRFIKATLRNEKTGIDANTEKHIYMSKDMLSYFDLFVIKKIPEQNQSPHESINDIFPQEITTHILSFLNSSDLSTCKLVSKSFYNTANDYTLWRSRLKDLFQENHILIDESQLNEFKRMDLIYSRTKQLLDLVPTNDTANILYQHFLFAKAEINFIRYFLDEGVECDDNNILQVAKLKQSFPQLTDFAGWLNTNRPPKKPDDFAEALKKGHVDRARFLLDNGIPLPTMTQITNPRPFIKEREALLITQANDIPFILAMFKHGYIKYNNIGFVIALASGNLTLVKYFEEKQFKMKYDHLPFIIASGNKALIKAYFQHELPMTKPAQGENAALIAKDNKGRIEFIFQLLMKLAHNKSQEILRFLIEKGYDAQDIDVNISIKIALEHQQDENAKYLLNNYLDSINLITLATLIDNGNASLLKFAFEKKPNLLQNDNSTHDQRQVIFNLVMKQEYEKSQKMLKILSQYNFNIDHFTIDQPIKNALANKQYHNVEFLLDTCKGKINRDTLAYFVSIGESDYFKLAYNSMNDNIRNELPKSELLAKAIEQGNLTLIKLMLHELTFNITKATHSIESVNPWVTEYLQKYLNEQAKLSEHPAVRRHIRSASR